MRRFFILSLACTFSIFKANGANTASSGEPYFNEASPSVTEMISTRGAPKPPQQTESPNAGSDKEKNHKLNFFKSSYPDKGVKFVSSIISLIGQHHIEQGIPFHATTLSLDSCLTLYKLSKHVYISCKTPDGFLKNHPRILVGNIVSTLAILTAVIISAIELGLPGTLPQAHAINLFLKFIAAATADSWPKDDTLNRG